MSMAVLGERESQGDVSEAAREYGWSAEQAAVGGTATGLSKGRGR